MKTVNVHLNAGGYIFKTKCKKSVNLTHDVVVVVVVDPKLLSSSLLYSQCQADESACLLQLV